MLISNFLFHRVHPQRDPLWDPMRPELFDKCLDHISRKFEIIRIEDLSFIQTHSAKRPYATIMFDDGYKDNIEYAAPILDKYKCKASFYVVTNSISFNRLTWTHFLEFSFQQTNQNKLDLSFDFLPEKLRVKELTNKEKRINFVKILKPYLKTIDSDQRNLVLEQIKASFKDVDEPKIMMNWNDLQQLVDAGHYIGSHSVSHDMLGTVRNEDTIRMELKESGEAIRDKLGYFPASISYPIGSFNEKVKQISRESGYRLGLAVQQKKYNLKRHDSFEIPRIELYNESWFKTNLRIHDRLETVKRIIRY